MVMIMNVSFASPTEIAKEVIQTLEHAENNEASWFQNPPLRKRIFDRLYQV